MRSNKELPCQNCLFIEMGEMACYQETCPDCGRVPPSRSREIKKYRENLEVLRGEVTFNQFFWILSFCVVIRSKLKEYAQKYILLTLESVEKRWIESTTGRWYVHCATSCIAQKKSWRSIHWKRFIAAIKTISFFHCIFFFYILIQCNEILYSYLYFDEINIFWITYLSFLDYLSNKILNSDFFYQMVPSIIN